MTDAPLWSWQELCASLALVPVTGPDVRGISIDSRTLVAGDLFIAIEGNPGPRFHSSGSAGRDGHEFVDAAISAGAAGLLVSKAVNAQVPTLLVPDTLDALWQLGAKARERMLGSVIAITGSAGPSVFLRLGLLRRDGRHPTVVSSGFKVGFT